MKSEAPFWMPEYPIHRPKPDEEPHWIEIEPPIVRRQPWVIVPWGDGIVPVPPEPTRAPLQ